MQLEAREPRRHEIGASREEASLEHTEDDAEPDHLGPVVYESESLWNGWLAMTPIPIPEVTHNHDASPQDADGGKESARSKLAHDDRCGRLEEDVRDEENEDDNTVSVDARRGKFEVLGHPAGLLGFDFQSHS